MREAQVVRAFVGKDGNGGNPAGVVLEAETLTSEERQGIAQEVNLSETAFHYQGDMGEGLKFHTPTSSIDYCGHATVATFGLLAKDRSLGEYEVHMADTTQRVRIEQDKVGLQQSLRSIEEVNTQVRDSVASSIGHFFNSSVIREAAIVDTGNRFLVLELDSVERLTQLSPDFEFISRISNNNNLIGYYLFATDAEGNHHTRMFAPAYGIDEEAATGMAAGCLGAYLYKRDGEVNFTVQQGHLMDPPSPSEIDVRIEEQDGDSPDIWVYGRWRVSEE